MARGGRRPNAGRPRLGQEPGEPMRGPVYGMSFAVEEAMLETLREASKRTGTSQAELVRNAIRRCYMSPKVWST